MFNDWNMEMQWGAVIFATIAAILWWKSAIVKMPSSFSIQVIPPDGINTPFGMDNFVGHGHSPGLRELGPALCKQSELSADAAMFAGLSALCQAIAFAIGIIK